MTHCLDVDALLALEQALEWDGTAGVTHLARCAGCRSALAELELLHMAVAPSDPDREFVARVTESLARARTAEHQPAAVVAIPRAPAAPTSPRRVGATQAPVLGLILFLVATSTVWCALAFVQAALGQPPGVSTWDSSLLPLAALVGAVAWWRTRREAAMDRIAPASQPIAR